MTEGSPCRSLLEEEISGSVLTRLMIVHHRLPEICSKINLDEGASDEELSEHILYYREAATRGSQQNDVSIERSRASSNLAIKFSGVCAALRSLPDVFQEDDDDDRDADCEVHFADSTLVFVQLEENSNADIYAVAQVGQSDQDFSEMDRRKHACSPLAVRKSIEKCHKLFCLLRGSIHHRLAKADGLHVCREWIEDIVECPYPGMDRLYDLRRKLRRSKTKLSKLYRSATADVSALEAEISALDGELQNLVAELPIRSLRVDLANHYDDYLIGISSIAESQGVVYRCLVDCVPTPILQPSKSISRNFGRSLPSNSTLVKLTQTLHTILRSQRTERDSPILLGVSCFCEGRLLKTAVASDVAGSALVDEKSPTVTTETAYLLIEYMMGFKCKRYHQSKTSDLIRVATQACFQRPFKHTESGGRFEEDRSGSCEPKEHGEFFRSPPLSMFNTSDKVIDVHLPGFGSVWMPEIILCGQRGNDDAAANIVSINLVLYEHDALSFLLYILPAEVNGSHLPEKRNISPYSDFLNSMAGLLADLVVEVFPVDGRPVLSLGSVSGHDAGQDVLLIDRQEMSLLLLSSRASSDTRHGAQRKGFSLLGKKPKMKHKLLDASLGFDCRHALATRLPLDVIIAFDDMMSEIHLLQEKSVNGSHRDKVEPFELCTYSRHGWMYAHASHDRELYVLFNPRSFVTIVDVQDAVGKLKQSLLTH